MTPTKPDMTKHDKPTSDNHQDFIIRVQREIINTQRMILEEWRTRLPEDYFTRKTHFLNEAMKHLEDIHKVKISKDSA